VSRGGQRPQAMGQVAMGQVAMPPPGVTGGTAAADLCGSAKGVGVVASQEVRDALCW